jgi:hypothetical protein
MDAGAWQGADSWRTIPVKAVIIDIQTILIATVVQAAMGQGNKCKLELRVSALEVLVQIDKDLTAEMGLD